ncbi:lipopolysaccharide kinase InaA family protein [Corallibacter sp.]|uniref:lipopolysaccharide kinase InaA family protein n=1 Tax=Corallibacter sp. TaxID=2038084 RepID=UPI003AB57A61
MNIKISDKFLAFKDDIENCINNFSASGTLLSGGDRNSLKTFKVKDKVLNIKSFKIPNLVNQVVYKFFRKSKAQRSFEYASKLMALNVGTPQPIAYYEKTTSFLFKNSYYVSEHLDYDITYRELMLNLDYPNNEKILRAFTRFTYNLHKKGINFLDHSPGNTLIQINNGDYKFYLVDLNRMEFKHMSFNTRIRNFERLSVHESVVRIMSDEYAKCSGEDFQKIFNLMWSSTQKFQDKFYRKIRLKKKLLFWRKK